ncbi:serine/threonine-protein kinase [Cumulibacter manganitolerans]|uniref:serine/threonine-protein kinase n=1 Tax=Cumulibacter manganitolerans TaxID=1884992 RepID=UPI001296BE12|nr:serine/threonine-protein kinase [Cumulibacter manganitolerans]
MNPPELIADRYRVIRALGRGGMGMVWLCDDPVLGRQVAVKQIAAGVGIDGRSVERARREARTVAAIANPHVVQIHDIVEDTDQLWLVMEYVESENLQKVITDRGRMPVEQVVHIGAQLAEGLAAAHAAGVVHRDVKPANILITPQGDAKLVDFGIARKENEEQVTLEGVMSGTPVYFSPELARTGEPDFPSDVWALGATLFAAVEGKAPYDDAGTPVAMLHRVIEQEPREPVHAGILERPIGQMMERDPEQRWTSEQAAEALRVLDVIAETSTIVSDEAPPEVQVLAADVVRSLPARGPALAQVAAAGVGPRHAAVPAAAGRPWAAVIAVGAAILLVLVLLSWWMLG